MDVTDPAAAPGDAKTAAGERYLLLADISGYTAFMAGVEVAHGVDFSGGIPAAYSILAALLDAVITGLEPDFAVVKLEGDAVFADAPAPPLDGRGDRVLDELVTMYAAFIASRTRAIPTSDHICSACPRVAELDLKVVLHRGITVRQSVGGNSDLLGPAVTVAHRLLKNTVRDRIGYRPYLFVTDAAAAALGVPDLGLAHHDDYPDVGRIDGRVIELGTNAPESVRRRHRTEMSEGIASPSSPAHGRAARLYGRRDLRLEDRASPSPGPGEVLLDVTAVGLCGSDRHWYVDGSIGGTTVGQPLVLGHEIAATIALGPETGTRVRSSLPSHAARARPASAADPSCARPPGSPATHGQMGACRPR